MAQQDPTFSAYDGAGGVGIVGGPPSMMSIPGEVVILQPQVPVGYMTYQQQPQQVIDQNPPYPGQFVSSPLSVPPPSTSLPPPPPINPYAADALPLQPTAPPAPDDGDRIPAGPPPPQAPPSIEGAGAPIQYQPPERDTPPPDSACKKFGHVMIYVGLVFFLLIFGLIGFACATASVILHALSKIRHHQLMKAKGSACFVIFLVLFHFSMVISGYIMKGLSNLLYYIAFGCYWLCLFALAVNEDWRDSLKAKKEAWEKRFEETGPTPDAPPTEP